MSQASSVSMPVVYGLLHAAEQSGACRRELLSSLQLSAAARDRIPEWELYGVVEQVLALSSDPALGLHWIAWLMERSFGPVAHMLVYAASLREAFALFQQFEPLICEGPAVSALSEDSLSFSVRQVGWKGASPRTRSFAAESVLTGFLKLVHVYFATARPLRVRFEHAAPAYAGEYERAFGITVEFAQPCTEIVFERSLLDAASPHADASMYEAQRTIAERRLVQVTHTAPYAMRVRELLRARCPGRVHMADVARELGISERTLRKALTDESTSYREIEHAVLAAMARELLQDGKRSIQETAFKMGFSDATTFHRAVKRWTGLTPSVLRERASSPP